MNKGLFVILIFLLLVSCKSKTAPTVATKARPVAGTILQLINKRKPGIQGIWVKQDYIDKLTATRSPVKAADKAIGITTMHVNTTLITGDSLTVKVSYDNHQVGDVVLKFKPGQNKAAMPFGENELGYTVNNTDTALVLYQYYNKQWVLTPYVKALPQPNENNMQEGITYLINKNLIAGRYSFTDSLGKVVDVVFKENGEVSGLLNFKKYFVESSFETKIMNNPDQITFNIFSSDEKTYAFKIGTSSLNLYDIQPNAKSALLMQGNLRYRLIKLNSR